MEDAKGYFSALGSLSSCDGRHILKTFPLREYFSEFALHKYRVLVELKHLLKLSEVLHFPLDKEVIKIHSSFSQADAEAIAAYDHFGRNGIGPVEHDMKAVELFLQEKLPEHVHPWIHFGLTSEDVNNIAYTCMIRDALRDVWLPSLLTLCTSLKKLAASYKEVPLLSRTHGQPASPTTFGKEMAVFLHRFCCEIKELREIKFSAKLNGSVGNYHAFVAANIPNIDWIAYSQSFVESFGFECELLTNQRGPKNRLVQLFQTLIRVNAILKDLDIDLWLYTQNGLLLQKPTQSHVGSSVMPHKINPWFVESSEGNCELSTALFELFSRELDVSRLQRDLSDSNLERNYGLAFGYSLIALKYTDAFLQKIIVDAENMLRELRGHPEVLAEAYQTILRMKGNTRAYDLFKEFFRKNKCWSTEEVQRFIDTLTVDDATKRHLKDMQVEKYVGHAPQLVDIALQEFENLEVA